MRDRMTCVAAALRHDRAPYTVRGPAKRRAYGPVAWVEQIGHSPILYSRFDEAEIDNNAFFSPDAVAAAEWEKIVDAARKDGSSLGAVVVCEAYGVPAGWGAPLYAKLDSELAAAMMSINAVKGVEIGDGFASVSQRGSQHRDELTPDGFLSNHAGGILGGISSGQPIVVRLAVKPTSSITIPGRTIDLAGRPVEIVTTGRHDPCVGLRATPIAEAMMALVLMDHFLLNRAQCGDVRAATPVITATR